MPRYTGALLSFVIVVICLGINIIQFPVAREMMNDSNASQASPHATQNSHAEDSSPDLAKEKEILSEPVVAPPADKTVTIPSSLVLQQSSPADQKNSPDISPQEGSSVPPHGGSPSRVSVSPSLIPSLPLVSGPLVSSNGYEPIPAEKIKPRGATLAAPLAQNKAELQGDEPTASESVDETEQEENPEEIELESTFQLSSPNPAYGEQAGKEETLEPGEESNASEPQPDKLPPEQLKPLPEVAQTPPGEPGPWSAINVKVRPYDMVEAFRNSPLNLDVPFIDETEANPQDPYADP